MTQVMSVLFMMLRPSETRVPAPAPGWGAIAATHRICSLLTIAAQACAERSSL